MDTQTDTPEELVKQESSQTGNKSNNNNDNTNGIKESICSDSDTTGINSGIQEPLITSQDYLEIGSDDSDSDDRSDSFKQRKRFASEASAFDQDSGLEECNGNKSNGRKHDNGDCYTDNNSTSGFQDEYSYSSNGSLKQENGNEQSSRRKDSSEEPEQMRKLFIGGLDYKTSEETLKKHFEKFGDVIDCVVMREPQSKRSRGFGFVIYAKSTMVDKAQDSRPHEVDGREVQSKRAISREDSGKPEAQATVKKVYLGGLSDDIGESELRDYFKDFGNIVNVNIVAHKDTGKRRGFAFVEFEDHDPVDKIVLKKFHTIRDKRIEAKKAIPKVEMDARKRGDPRTAMAGAMIALPSTPLDGPGRPRSGRGSTCLWDGNPYSACNYPSGYTSQGINGYPPHYHSPSGHYSTNNWVMHGGQGGGGGPYGFRGAHSNGYGRNNYGSQTGNWAATEYNGFAASQGGGGPMRLSYQHRSWGPYGSGYGTHRGRGYNP